jgi:hypothetical protein
MAILLFSVVTGRSTAFSDGLVSANVALVFLTCLGSAARRWRTR